MLRNKVKDFKEAKSMRAEASDDIAEFQRQASERMEFGVGGPGAMRYLPDFLEAQKPLTGAGINTLELINESIELGSVQALKAIIFNRYREGSEAPRLTSEELNVYLGHAVIELIRLMKSVDFNLTGNHTFSDEDINELIQVAKRLASRDDGSNTPEDNTPSTAVVVKMEEYRKP